MLLARDSDTCPASKVPSVVRPTLIHGAQFSVRCHIHGGSAVAVAAAATDDDDDNDDNDDDDDDDDTLICSRRVDGDRNYAFCVQRIQCVCRDTRCAILSANSSRIQ